MALINCPECNKEVSDKAEACPNCGFGVAKYIERQRKIAQIQEEAEREAFLFVKQKKKEERERAEQARQAELEEINRKNSIYNRAVNLFESQSSKDVEEAEKLFRSISGWKDSDEYCEKCKEKIVELKRQEKIDKKERRKKLKKIGLIICIVSVAILGVGFTIYQLVLAPKLNYQRAIKALESEKYTTANMKFKQANIRQEELLEYTIDTIIDGEYQKSDVAIQYLDEDTISSGEVQNAYVEKACSSAKIKDVDSFEECFRRLESMQADEYAEQLRQKGYSYAVQYFDAKDYEIAQQLFSIVKSSENNSSEYIDLTKALIELQRASEDGIFTIEMLETLENASIEYKLSVEEENYINDMKSSYSMIQGAFYGSPYYIYIKDRTMYWGDSTGCSAMLLQYEFSSRKWLGDYGEDFTTISSDEVHGFRTYRRVPTSELPSTFSSYIN